MYSISRSMIYCMRLYLLCTQYLGQGFGVEFFATFFFVFVVFACYDKSKGEDPKSRDVGGALVSPPPLRWSTEETTVAPFVIGLTYAAVLLFAVS